MLSLPDGAKTIGKVLVKTGLLLHSQDASSGLWKGLILVSTDPAQHSYLVMSWYALVPAPIGNKWCQFQTLWRSRLPDQHSIVCTAKLWIPCTLCHWMYSMENGATILLHHRLWQTSL